MENKFYSKFVYIFIGIIAISSVKKTSVESLSCFCGASPCELPECCPSGTYALDACGCCPVCAQAEHEVCGGPFRTSGVCTVGHSCLRKCDCQTEKGQDCIFPFTYKGETYTDCTTKDSLNKKAWCATQVDSDNVVINGKWGDCSFGCPGNGLECDATFLFNINGRCVNSSQAEDIKGRSAHLGQIVQLEPGVSNAIKAPKCEEGKDFDKRCRCSFEEVSNSTGSHSGKPCEPLSFSVENSVSHGWCFLENIQDPSNPTVNCFEDAQWSPSHGRFWSNLACKPNRANAIIVEGRKGSMSEEDSFAQNDGYLDEDSIIIED